MNKQELINMFTDFIEERFPELIEESEPSFQNGDYYWVIDCFGDAIIMSWNGDVCDKKALKNNAIFKTEEEAKFEAERLKVLRELEKLGRPFVDGGDNWGFFLNEKDDLAVNCLLNCRCVYGDYYFDTAEEVEKAVNKIGRDRIKKYLFRVK